MTKHNINSVQEALESILGNDPPILIFFGLKTGALNDLGSY